MRFQHTYATLSCAFILCILAGCSSPSKEEGRVEANTTTNTQAKAESASPIVQTSQQMSDPLRGLVKETVNASGYTYVLLSSGAGEIWAAARQFPVAVGDNVEVAGLVNMGDFKSKSLDRVFKDIWFVGSAMVVSGDATGQGNQMQGLPPGHPPMGDETAQGLPSGHPPLGNADAEGANTDGAVVQKIEPFADGVTVSELFTRRNELKDKVVKFRGRVVKATGGILGVNWMHVQDGSGEKGANDITITSKQDLAEVGSVVDVTGTLELDVDFGSGYSYEVIVQNATVTPSKSGD